MCEWEYYGYSFLKLNRLYTPQEHKNQQGFITVYWFIRMHCSEIYICAWLWICDVIDALILLLLILYLTKTTINNK